MEGIVSLPTRLSQIALKLVTIENESNSSDQTPKTKKPFISEELSNGFDASEMLF